MQRSNQVKTRDQRPGGRLALVYASLVLAFSACSSTPQTRQEWLSMFLDGVPDPNAPVAATPGDAPPQGPETARTTARPTGAEATLIAHAPYQKRQCQSCHESAFSHKLRLPAQDLCLSCHQDIVGARAFAHAPAVSGDCLMCHQPHSAEVPHLLVATGPELCLQCHEARSLTPIAAHRESGAAACYSCHDPHGGDRTLFLRAPAVAQLALP